MQASIRSLTVKTISRRCFLGNVGAGTAGVVAPSQTPAQSAVSQSDRVLRLAAATGPTNPKDVRLTVKPVGNYMIHGNISRKDHDHRPV